MNQQHSDNEQESLRSQRMTEDEARAVIDLWQQEETDSGGLTNRPAVTDVAEGLGIRVEDVQRLLAQVRARHSKPKPPLLVKPFYQISPPPAEELAETVRREAELHTENVQFRRRVLALVAAMGVTNSCSGLVAPMTQEPNMPRNPIGEIVEAGTTNFVAQCLEVPRQNEPHLYDPPPFGSFVKILGPRVPNSAPPAPNNGGAGEEGFLTPPLLGVGGLPGEPDDEADPFASPEPQATRALGTALPAATYALVYGANTASLEMGRRPSALGFADEDELRRRQPQIFELLRTEFSGLLVAYSEGDGKALRRHLPPKPPRIHSRVLPCDPAEVLALTEDLSFLRAVLLPSGGAMAGVPSDELAAACLRQARDAQTNDQEFLLRAGRTLAMLLADDYDRLQAILRNIL